MYNKEHKLNGSNSILVGENFISHGFVDNKGEFLGFENGKIILEFDTLINEENTKKLYETMKGYYEKYE